MYRGYFKYREIFNIAGFHAVCYIGTMPRLVQIETCFFWDNSLYHITYVYPKIEE